MSGSRRRWWLWALVAVLAVLLAAVAVVAIPILTHDDQGLSHQDPQQQDWPLTATATGDDGRERSILVTDAGGEPDTSALEPGDRLVVHGSGYDAEQGIYVAICAIPGDPSVKPGPCLGGVPSQEGEEVEAGTVQYAPSNWINDDWAWKLFGARSYDDPDAGTFTAYLEVPEPADEHLDCRDVACAIYTRNDHTAASDRVQDLFVPVGFAG